MDSEAPATEVPKDENQSDSQVEQLKPITPAAEPVATSTNETQTASQDSQPPAVAETDKSTATEQSQTANQTAAVAEVKEEVHAPTTVTNEPVAIETAQTAQTTQTDHFPSAPAAPVEAKEQQTLPLSTTATVERTVTFDTAQNAQTTQSAAARPATPAAPKEHHPWPLSTTVTGERPITLDTAHSILKPYKPGLTPMKKLTHGVEIKSVRINMAYMGGYRNTVTNVYYLHASTQTPRPEDIRRQRVTQRFHRETQTVHTRNKAPQSTNSTTTQTPRKDLFMTQIRDRYITPYAKGAYVDSEAWEKRVQNAVLTLQCFFRRTKAVWRVRELRRRRIELLQAQEAQERRQKAHLDAQKRKALEARLHPRRKQDFEMFYSALEQWRQAETARINLEYGQNVGWTMEPLRRSKLAELLDQQVMLLQKIDRLKISAGSENRQLNVKRLLETMSQSVRWSTNRGKGPEVLMDTPTILRARELKELYQALMRFDKSSIDERLQVLLHVKYTVKEYDSPLTREIVGLIDREGDLISRGRHASSLTGLRQRLGNLFLQFVQTPEFNPQASRFSTLPILKAATEQVTSQMELQLQHRQKTTKLPTIPHSIVTTKDAPDQVITSVASTMNTPIYFCRACSRYLPSTAFYLHTTMRHLGKCKQCTVQQNQAHQRMNEEGVRRMNDWIGVEESNRIRDLSLLLERMQGDEAKRVISTAMGYYGLSAQFESPEFATYVKVMEQRVDKSDVSWMLISDMDVRYVVETIWKGTSAISSSAQTQFRNIQTAESQSAEETLANEQARAVLQGAMKAVKKDLSDIFNASDVNGKKTVQDVGKVDYDGLILTRWDPFQPLTPWNAILLTKQEAVAHDRHVMALAVQQLVDALKRKPSEKQPLKLSPAPELLYSETFVRQIKAKHWMARQHFEQLPVMEKAVVEQSLEKREKYQQQLAHAREKSAKTVKIIEQPTAVISADATTVSVQTTAEKQILEIHHEHQDQQKSVEAAADLADQTTLQSVADAAMNAVIAQENAEAADKINQVVESLGNQEATSPVAVENATNLPSPVAVSEQPDQAEDQAILAAF